MEDFTVRCIRIESFGRKAGLSLLVGGADRVVVCLGWSWRVVY